MAYREEMSSPGGISVGVLSCDVGILVHQGVRFVLGLFSRVQCGLCAGIHETALSKAEHQSEEWGVLE